MSYQTQEKHMKRLAELVKQDLSYIHGPKESGPNGAKKEYLQTGKTFFRAMAKDLGFVESKIYDMPGGIGVGGDVVMMGMWNDGNGIYILLHPDDFTGCIMYRRIKHMKDFHGDYNRHLMHNYLLRSYNDLLEKFLDLKREDAAYAKAS
jgi:hypothetical protein